MKKKVIISVCSIVIAVIVFGFYYYKKSTNKEMALLEEPQENPHAEEDSEQRELPNAFVEDNADSDFAEPPMPAMADEIKSEPTNSAEGKENDDPSPMAAMRDKMLRKHLESLYEDLFKELVLTQEQRKQVEDHLVKSLKTEAEFDFKLIDPKVSVDKLLQDQKRLSDELQQDLSGILSLREQNLIRKHQKELPQKTQRKQAMMLADALKIEGEERENATNAIMRAVQKLDTKKSMGEYTAEDIHAHRKQFGGAKPGDPEFMRATLKASSERVKEFLKELKDLPKEQYEALKKQVESFEMIRQSLENQGKQKS